jgi:hypothetical protein
MNPMFSKNIDPQTHTNHVAIVDLIYLTQFGHVIYCLLHKSLFDVCLFIHAKTHTTQIDATKLRLVTGISPLTLSKGQHVKLHLKCTYGTSLLMDTISLYLYKGQDPPPHPTYTHFPFPFANKSMCKKDVHMHDEHMILNGNQRTR